MLLAQQQGASQGDIQLDGRPLASWGNREFARQVAYLPQQLPGAKALTGRELVAFGRYFPFSCSFLPHLLLSPRNY